MYRTVRPGLVGCRDARAGRRSRKRRSRNNCVPRRSPPHLARDEVANRADRRESFATGRAGLGSATPPAWFGRATCESAGPMPRPTVILYRCGNTCADAGLGYDRTVEASQAGPSEHLSSAEARSLRHGSVRRATSSSWMCRCTIPATQRRPTGAKVAPERDPKWKQD
jgi:hypothetical protein